MEYKIIEIDTCNMEKYAKVPISFLVKTILEPVQIDGGVGGLRFIEKSATPYKKDYDELGSGPKVWHKRFDTSNWISFAAVSEKGEYIGGATVAYNTENVNMLEGRSDMTVLWDIRVDSEYRQMGVGRALFEHAADWSRNKKCFIMKIETQNINVKACRFYSAMGSYLGGIKMHQYKEDSCKHEIMFIWYLDL